jgi:hypothetical protein
MSQLPPIPSGFTSVIATRTFDVIQNGVSSRLIVEIGMPIQDVETIAGVDWRCPIRFVKGASIQEHRSFGVDAFQALQLALQLIHNEITQMSQDRDCQVLLFDEPYNQII